MDEWIGLVILYVVGAVLLVADLFLPSHGILTISSLGFICYALYRTYAINELAGMIATAGVVVLVPATLVFMIKTWHRTPIGRRIAPPNPVLTENDRMPIEEMRQLIGCEGRTATALRPVGTCVFDGRRVECVAETGMLPAGVLVEGVRLSDRTVVVRPVRPPSSASHHA